MALAFRKVTAGKLAFRERRPEVCQVVLVVGPIAGTTNQFRVARGKVMKILCGREILKAFVVGDVIWRRWRHARAGCAASGGAFCG